MPNLQKKISGIKDDIASDFDYEPTFRGETPFISEKRTINRGM
jgi:hypothetical protein